MIRSMVGVRAPEFIGDDNDWINSKPLRLADLRGKLVLIDFWDYTCVNCIRTLPYVTEWHKRYHDKGLVIVGIHTPEFEFAKERENVEEAAERYNIKYPILLDPGYENWSAYANRYWPREYLVSADGHIIYDHAGEGNYGETERVIQEELQRINPTIDLPKLIIPATEKSERGAVCYPMTPELYTGYRRGNMGSPEGYTPNKVVDYTDPENHEEGKVYAKGPFFNGPEYLRHARHTDTSEDYIAIKYHALEVNAVLNPNGRQFNLTITQDGSPLPMTDAGPDVFLSEDGSTSIVVDEPRLYRIVENQDYGTHELTLSSESPEFSIYAFTFGSCEEH